MWCVPRLDDEYIERMEDLLRLYARPLSWQEPVICLDEKPVCLHAEKRQTQIAYDGSRRRDYEYRRQGTANLFVGVEPKAGAHMIKATKTRDRFQFARFLREIARKYPHATIIHLVMDNLSTHSKTGLIDAFGAIEAGAIWSRFKVHYTPKHGSWLNQAEIEISLVSRECLGNRRLGELPILKHEVKAWARAANAAKRKIDWRFRVRDARKKFRYIPGDRLNAMTSRHDHLRRTLRQRIVAL